MRHISRLRLSGFRNYAAAALDLDHRHLVLVGPNGAGKTNMLEAVSLLAPGRGLRRATFESLVAHGSDEGWAVAATIQSDDGPIDIGTGASADDASRRVRINGANARAIEDMSAYLRLLWLTPSMDGLFTGPASDRRRFLDRLVTTLIPNHSATVADFDKTTRQRNRLLEDNADPRWLTALEAQMAQQAAAIHFARTDSLMHLQNLIDANTDTSAFPASHLQMTPVLAGDSALTASDLETELAHLWSSNRAQDRAAGRTLVGPHRVDFEVTHRQKDMPAALGSTGEQKALLIGLVLVQARLVQIMSGIAPFLLLDEIAAHLDPDRRAALFSALDALNTQCFLTGTDPILFDAMADRAQRVMVNDGRLESIR